MKITKQIEKMPKTRYYIVVVSKQVSFVAVAQATVANTQATIAVAIATVTVAKATEAVTQATGAELTKNITYN